MIPAFAFSWAVIAETAHLTNVINHHLLTVDVPIIINIITIISSILFYFRMELITTSRINGGYLNK